MHARYDMGEHAASDISIDLKGTPAVVISAGGTVRLRGGIPREWEYFRALNVVLRAVDLRAMYDTDLTGEWRVTRRSDRSGSEAAVLSPHADTSIPAFTAEAFEHVRAVVRRLPGEIEVARVPPVQNAGGRWRQSSFSESAATPRARMRRPAPQAGRSNRAEWCV